MPFTYRRINDVGGSRLKYNSGKEMLQLWLELGSISKVIKIYNERHPEDNITWYCTASTRIRRWSVANCSEAIAMIKSANPDIPDDKIYETITTWATRTYKYDRFCDWIADKPWTKQFESDYKRWYNVD